MRKEGVAQQDRHLVPPARRRCRLPSPDGGSVEDVVVNQRGHMNHLNDHGQRDVIGTDSSAHSRGEHDQKRPQPLAATREKGAEVRADPGVDLFRLAGDLPVDLLQGVLEPRHHAKPIRYVLLPLLVTQLQNGLRFLPGILRDEKAPTTIRIRIFFCQTGRSRFLSRQEAHRHNLLI
ncbi:protein of unknown function [Methylacidimicrobium sp. AP8]|nr:protein of unknown function [Methylacidimicrobium sp. AP8]